MKPSTFYQSRSGRVERVDLDVLRDHVKGVNLDMADWSRNRFIEVRYHVDDFSGHSYTVIFSVWFKGKPFMLCRNDRYCSRYVTHKAVYADFVAYVTTLLPPKRPKRVADFVDPETDIPDLDKVNGFDISKCYNPNLVPKFKVGDIVMACVPEQYSLDQSKKTIWTRCRIEWITPCDPKLTYLLLQLDRRFKKKKDPSESSEIVIDIGNGTLDCEHGNDQTVRALNKEESLRFGSMTKTG